MPELKQEAVEADQLGQVDADFTGSALGTHSHNLDKVVEETVTVTADAGTLANTPALVQMLYASAGGVTGPLEIIPGGGTPATGQVALNMTNGAIATFAGDAITEIKATYLKVATTATSAGTPAGTVALNAA